MTTYAADGGMYDHKVYADAKDESKTERGKVIEKVPLGARVLFRKLPPMKNKASGRREIEVLYGDVLDVQKP